MRVSIARSLLQSPHLILFDEPFSALDEQTRWGLQKEVLKLNREEKMTVIFVTHSIQEACTLSDRIILFNRRGEMAFDLKHPVPNSNKTEAYFRSSEHFELVQKISDEFQKQNGSPL